MMAAKRLLRVQTECWPIAGKFAISRGAVTEVVVVVASISADGVTGRGESRPYARYDETAAGVCRLIQSLSDDIADGLTREALQARLPAGAARNALDAALWDLEAKQTGLPVWCVAGLPDTRPLVTAYTLSLDSPDAMGAAARKASDRPLLKIKLGGGADDVARLRAVRREAPEAGLLVDANEGWDVRLLGRLIDACAEARVALIEQPLPAGGDEALRGLSSPVPICADESAHDRGTLDELCGKYQAINIKLDKTGGLTEALLLRQAARERGLCIMVGCMVATSLAMAPAMLVAQGAEVVDLDGPLLLARDRQPGMRYEGSLMMPPPRALWG